MMTISNLIRIKYVANGKVLYGSFGKPQFVLSALDRMIAQGKAAIAVNEDGTEYIPPKPKVLLIDAIVAHLKKPENVAARRKAAEQDWILLREKEEAIAS